MYTLSSGFIEVTDLKLIAGKASFELGGACAFSITETNGKTSYKEILGKQLQLVNLAKLASVCIWHEYLHGVEWEEIPDSFDAYTEYLKNQQEPEPNVGVQQVNNGKRKVCM